MPVELRDKVAVVTGASRGIGKAIALALAAAGADVVCTARSTQASPAKLPGTVDETAREISALGRRALAIPVDITRDEEVEAMARRALAEFGRVDILVNNAGISAPGSFLDLPVKRWDLVMNVNLRGSYLCTKAFLPAMVERRTGSIINISSLAASTEGMWGVAYGVAKAAVERLTVGLAAEMAPHGVVVNCLRIDLLIASEGFVYLNPGVDTSGWEKAETAAEAVLWLTSREPDYTGNILALSAFLCDRKRTEPA